MQRLRTAGLLARAVLAWFALTVCAAALAPLFQGAQRLEVLRVQALVAAEHAHHGHEAAMGDESAAPAGHGSHGMECPLCLVAVPLTSPAFAGFGEAPPSQRVGKFPPRLHPRPVAAAPLPARGPPAFS